MLSKYKPHQIATIQSDVIRQFMPAAVSVSLRHVGTVYGTETEKWVILA